MGRLRRLGRDSQKALDVAAQYEFAVILRQAGDRSDRRDRVGVAHLERVVAAEHHPSGPPANAISAANDAGSCSTVS